jgi:cyclophilin family peptidyl-prolyl cis-trans isomerase/HEAT repeat protein
MLSWLLRRNRVAVHVRCAGPARHGRARVTAGGAALLAPLVVLVAGACASSGPRRPALDTVRTAPVLRGAPLRLRSSPELAEIAMLEDGRTTGGGRLQEFASNADPEVRLHAVRAVGRLPFPEYGREATELLCRALEDPAVREQAAFGLGLRADPKSAGVLASYLNHPDARLRARVVEAASRVSDARLHREILVLLRDADLSVRIEAVLATARFQDDPRDEEVDRALVEALAPFTISSGRTLRTAGEAELVWRILYALSRRGSELGRGPFLEYARSDVPLERLFSVLGLARIAPAPEAVRAVSDVLRSPAARDDWRTAYEATAALGRYADPAAMPALIEAIEHPSAHVRAGALEALGAFPDHAETTLPVLRRGLIDLSTEARNAALRSLTRVLPAPQAFETVKVFARDPDPVLRLGAALALAQVSGGPSLALLRELARDRDVLVATRAVEGLGKRAGEARADLQALLANDDNGLRLAAVLALRELPDPSDVAPLCGAFSTSRGDISPEIAFEVLRNLGKIGGASAEAFVRAALEDARPSVRRVADAVLREDFHVEPPEAPALPRVSNNDVPLPGRDFQAWSANPVVEVETSRGSMTFELFPAEAPVHVHNFLSLARAGEYDGRTFHRVVPDFVVQGGDYRGDGNGGRPWKGDALRHEFGMRRFERGTLGMPRNEDVDSGGSQFFVTHRPAPHLDGRYTAFGELRSGGEVLDRLEVGDRILAVHLLP